MEFAQTLQKLMYERGVSNYQLAKALGCHQSNVAYWLNGDRTPQKRMRLAIAEYFGIPVSALNIKEKGGMIFDTSVLNGFEFDQEKVQIAVDKMQKETPTAESDKRPKLHSVARLESADITPEMDKHIAEYIDFLLNKNKHE